MIATRVRSATADRANIAQSQLTLLTSYINKFVTNVLTNSSTASGRCIKLLFIILPLPGHFLDLQLAYSHQLEDQASSTWIRTTTWCLTTAPVQGSWLASGTWGRKDLLSTDVLGGRATRGQGLGMVGLVTLPPLIGAPARRDVVYLRESHPCSKGLNFRSCIGYTADLPAGWSCCELMHGSRTRSSPTSALTAVMV